jgi:hypothetical protein
LPSDRRRCAITPATKVADLLLSWPELEEVLIAQAPAFRRLKNPVLRRTVARVATLEQAAGVGGVAVRDLVAALRGAAGIGEEGASPEEGTGPSREAEAPPRWLDPSGVVAILDADALLDAGHVPLTLATEQARVLAPGDLLRIDSGFRPVPLVEALSKQGYRTFVRETAPGRFETFVAAHRDVLSAVGGASTEGRARYPDGMSTAGGVSDARRPLHSFFASDHRRLEALLRRALQGEGPLDLAPFDAFRAGLLRHIGMEEKVLFPAAREALGGRPIPIAARLRVDHGAIAALLVPTPTRTIVADMLSVLSPHNRREEDPGGAYDLCDEALGTAAAERLVAKLREFPEPPLKPYNDAPAVFAHASANLDLARRQWHHEG